ncbi:MAG: transposase [Steroidobacteraceae bacterium]
MPKRRSYPNEFRAQVVELVRAGRTPESLAKECEPSAQTIRTWAKQADLNNGRRTDGLTSADQEELRKLRRENRQLKLERDILSKATAWFARETGTLPIARDGRREPSDS